MTAIRIPPDDLRCTAIIEATGERCKAWMARKQGLDVCAGHGKVSTALARAVKAEKAVEHDSLVLRALGARAVAAEQTAEEVDPFDPVSFNRAVVERDRARSEHHKALAALADKQAALLNEPKRTPEMIEAHLYWTRTYVYPEHAVPHGAIRDAKTGQWFTWRKTHIEPVNPFVPKNLRPPDPDVQRLLVERGGPEPTVDSKLANHIKVCQANGYALMHYASEAGMGTQEYLEWLHRQQADAWGHDVDLNDESVPEYEQVILPEIARVARRRAWHTVSAIR